MFVRTAADGGIAGSVLAEFVAGVVGALPRLLSGLVFLTLAYLAIRAARTALRSVLGRLYGDGREAIVDLGVTVVGLFLWFGAGLALLKIVGMAEVAASVGTASGFVGLGVAFALKEMIADTVAGVYLIQDGDFDEGDLVTTASTTGRIVDVDLRKTRIRTAEDDLVVVANREVEKRWVREAEAARPGASED